VVVAATNVTDPRVRKLRHGPDARAEARLIPDQEVPVETFTLIIWLWIGQRFEENRMLNLGREECIERLDVVERGRHTWNFQQRAPAKGQCVGSNGYTWPTRREITHPPVCASCGLLPGRRRI
jgi:hypothetical protein